MKRVLSTLCVFALLLCACSSEIVEPLSGDGDAVVSAPVSEPVSAPHAESAEASAAEESSQVRVKDITLSGPEPSEPDDQQYPIGYDPEAGPAYAPGGKLVYVALGDSIASGYALNDPKRKNYCALFAAMYGDCDYRNYAVKGYETDDLLKVMRGIDISDADLVTVSVGGNNIMHTVGDRFLPLYEDFGMGIIGEYFKTLVGLGDKERVDAFFTALKEAFNDDIVRAEVQRGLDKTKAELPQVLDRLHEMAPHAVIIIQTVYNPYKGLIINLPGIFYKDVSAFIDGFICDLNRIIIRAAERCDCELLDVYTAFENAEKDVLNAQTEFAIGKRLNLDPHPNGYGHELMAQLLLKKWNSLVKTNEE